MIWNNILIGIYVLILIANGYFWYKYNKNASPDEKKKEGWNHYYLIGTIFILTLLFKKMGW